MNKIIYKCRKCGEERNEEIVKMDGITMFGFLIAFLIMFFFGLYLGLMIIEKIQADSWWCLIGLFSMLGLFYCGIFIERYRRK